MSTDTSASAPLDALFPLPASAPPSPLCPPTLPGASDASAQAVTRALKDNHIRWHAYLNEMGFHNHTSHHLLAAYSLGASPSVVDAVYARHTPLLKPVVTGVEPITPENYFGHLGELKYYHSYREFYAREILERGAKGVLEAYVFSREANVGATPQELLGSRGGAPPPRMLNRLLAILIHPFIHAGYGLEFGLPGILAEGLGQMATHPADWAGIVPPELFDRVDAASLVEPPSSLPVTYSLALEKKGGNDHVAKPASPHALEILGRILADDSFDPTPLELPKADPSTALEKVCTALGPRLVRLAEEWYAGGMDAHAKIVELFWLNTVMYGVAGYGGRASAPGGKMNADFFLMHLVTSVLFMPSYAAYLSPRSLSLLVRTYFSACLACYIQRGRPALPIAEFYANVPASPVAPGSAARVSASAAEGTLDATNPSPNAWLPIVQSTLQHRDDHLAKVQRSLAHFAALLGMTPGGTFAAAAQAGLAGAEVLDGTLFVRVAGLTMDRVGWMREGEADAGWDRLGFVSESV
ncbi:hypothetical protein C8Q73DRAFT_449263 [Cubamyces lactineus]|nr:hypothetical protein C8Q73DRAFT_449263 [Cubamyces lactineus]